MQQTPTQEFYGAIEGAYQFFNKRLFQGEELPACIVVISRKKCVFGHLAYERWANTGTTEFRSELAINPSYVANYPIEELFQTIVHEQCHLWQYIYGNPSRKSYHNTEWADKMESLGLVPSSTGKPGGKRVGQYMSEYATSEGVFLAACKELLEGFSLKWLDRLQYPPVELPSVETEVVSVDIAAVLGKPVVELFPDMPLMEPQAAKKPLSKVKYTCSCKQNVWGKPGLKIRCEECGEKFEVG